MSNSADAPQKGSWQKRWRSNHQIGRGGQGTVFLLDRISVSGTEDAQAVLKQLRNWRSTEARRRMRREVTSLQMLRHSGVPRVIEDNSAEFEGKNPLYAILEYIDGETLAKRVSRSLLSLDEAITLCMALCDVLAHCHGRGVGHRDIKGDNIVLRGGDLTTPVIVDFGLSFNDEPIEATRANEQIHNRLVLLPELTDGIARDFVSDVTQVVAVLFWALTGEVPRSLLNEYNQPPHERTEPQAQLRKSAGNRWPALHALFATGFLWNRHGRYQNAQELAIALQAVRVWPAEAGREADWTVAFAEPAPAPAEAQPAPAPVDERQVQSMIDRMQQIHARASEASSGAVTFTPVEHAVAVSPVTVYLGSSMTFDGRTQYLDVQLVESSATLVARVDARYGHMPFHWAGNTTDADRALDFDSEYGAWLSRQYVTGWSWR